ncbi:uncharacterized protein [Triticum aestivum]|uniref:uncharacterized protein isoform X1 n=1 Tax=Triticum aestivum TaxID=4565 RepID=UPI001D02A301|nr:uncharacterized protein LOC123187210 isoform X1 [Triticum aestivum]
MSKAPPRKEKNLSAQDTSSVQLSIDNSCLVILFLPWCAKFLSIKPFQLLLDKGYLEYHITLGEINSKILQSSVVQYVQPANSVPEYMNSCAASATSYCCHWHFFTQFKRLWAPRTKEEVLGQMWSEPLFHAFCHPWDASDKQWNSEGHHKQHVNLLVVLVYSTVEHIDRLQFRCNAKSCPQIAKILNEPQVLEYARSVVSNFIQSDYLCYCAPCVRDQPKVNSSTSTSALTSPLAQQQDYNFGIESIFKLLLHILHQTSCSKFSHADHNLDKHNSETANRRTFASVLHNSNKFTSTGYICLGIPLVDSRTLLMELELLITQPAGHFPMLQPKPPWSPLFPPKIPTEFRSYMRTNSEFLRLTGVLWELTQSWPFTHHVSTLSSYWRCFSWGPGPMTTLFWLAHIIAEKLQEGLPCISESSTICGGLRAMRPITEDYIATFIVRWQFIQSVQSATSCVQWDPGGFDFVELAGNRHRLGRYTELQDSCSPSWLADGTSHML